MTNNDNLSYHSFEKDFLIILNREAPLKKKLIRGSHAPYMTKALKKAIMKRSELETKYLKNESIQNLNKYKKQRNFCSRLYKRERKKYYENLDLNVITDSKKFWKTVKPFLSEKSIGCLSNINLKTEDIIITDDAIISETFSTVFDNAVKSLQIENEPTCPDEFFDDENPIRGIIKKFERHQSIEKINDKLSVNFMFDFSTVSLEDIENELENLDSSKKGTFNNIPTNLLKKSSTICGPALQKIWNKELIGKGVFAENLKLAVVTLIHKKEDKSLAKNYRPVSVLPSVSKVFERLLQKQILEYINKYLSPFLCGYRKGFSAQTALISLIENWKCQLDEGGFGGAVLMDLSKAFDTINHELLLAKLHAYGFSENALQIINSYLSNRWQRVKINSTFSSWKELTKGVPQGSVIGPLLFNIYINDLFFTDDNISICNFADDTTFFSCNESLEEVIRQLECNSQLAISWFESNYMKLNTDKCHLIVAGNKFEQIWVKVGEDQIWEKKEVKLLGVTIDNELKFENHVNIICAKANKKLSALSRMSNYLTLNKKRTLFKAFFESQFKFCPLIWMFHNNRLNTKINKLHERALRIIYSNDSELTFDELLDKDNSFCIHHQNIKSLAIEMFKVVNNLSEGMIKDLFMTNDHSYSLRSKTKFIIPRVASVSNGQNSLRYLGVKIWNLVPTCIKQSETLQIFKTRIKCWKPVNCPCKICKTYISNVGYIN